MADLTYAVGSASVSKRIADISTGGVFIDTPVPAEVGTLLRLRFSLDGYPIEAKGTVVYSQPYLGMGVEFSELPRKAELIIAEYVADAVEPSLVGV